MKHSETTFVGVSRRVETGFEAEGACPVTGA